ncbi:MAG: HAMP domain-containing histidine kinase [Lachnospiraceae bacterium]|jgi:signal transduction histidine kinase|nr:HAMP domain-containing histidine kinase [Lachnospiraceae bacterium]
MFQKVHLRLAVLCGSITAFILLVMSLGYLYISEQGLKTSSFSSFQNDMNTLIANLEHQSVITHEWLTKMEGSGKYLIHISDNGVPFLFNERETEEEKLLFQEAWETWESSSVEIAPTAFSEIYHTEFLFSPKGSRGKDYYACAAVAEKNSGSLQVMILSPLDTLNAQIRRQRFLFFALDILAVLALSFFAWHFTRRILKPLEENQKKQAQFIASASHELRTPLAVILSCASASQKADGTQRTHFLEAMQSEGMRMSKLIDDMLLLTSADNKGWSIKMSSVEPDTLLLNLYEAFQPIAAEKNIALSITLPEENTPTLTGDKERITQVLSILLHNALSYTPAGGSVRLILTCHGKNILFSVEDNGPGIPDTEKERIFERFYRSDKSRSKKGHFGLGLCIAAEIIHAHRGKISVKDTPGGGSTFIVAL